MSLLSSGVYVNQTTPLFAALGSGGGGSTSTLQSPVSVVADVALGDADLTLTAQGVGVSTLTLSSPVENGLVMTGGQNSHVDLNGSTAAVNFGSAPQGVSVVLQTDSAPNILQIGNGTVPVATFDVAFNTINLGASAAVAGGTNTVVANAPITLTAPSKATFSPTTVTSTGGAWVSGPNTIALGGFGRGMYVIYGDTGAATDPIDLECRPISIFVIDPAFTVSGGGGGSDTNWNMSPNGTGGLTLDLTTAPSSAFSMKVMPLYLF
jgi:hypothetical protein